MAVQKGEGTRTFVRGFVARAGLSENATSGQLRMTIRKHILDRKLGPQNERDCEFGVHIEV